LTIGNTFDPGSGAVSHPEQNGIYIVGSVGRSGTAQLTRHPKWANGARLKTGSILIKVGPEGFSCNDGPSPAVNLYRGGLFSNTIWTTFGYSASPPPNGGGPYVWTGNSYPGPYPDSFLVGTDNPSFYPIILSFTNLTNFYFPGPFTLDQGGNPPCPGQIIASVPIASKLTYINVMNDIQLPGIETFRYRPDAVQPGEWPGLAGILFSKGGIVIISAEKADGSLNTNDIYQAITVFLNNQQYGYTYGAG
jgi:hypothetical protein